MIPFTATNDEIIRHVKAALDKGTLSSDDLRRLVTEFEKVVEDLYQAEQILDDQTNQPE